MLENLLKSIKDTLFTEEEIIGSYKEGVLVAVNVCAVSVLSKLLLTGSQEKLISSTKKKKYRPMVVIEKNNIYMEVLFLSTNRKYHTFDEIIFDISRCNFFAKNCFGINPREECYIFSKSYKQNYKGTKIKHRRIFHLPLELIIKLERYEKLPNFKRLKNICQIKEGDVLIKKCATCDTQYLTEISKYIQGEG
ncbi:hypothetical protein SAMN06265182_1487 [Persephonella hydrogeniphila]|uniref:Uncharacterized protein n=1 Tax=Persephonella hydrogeniphila TaxID=198703 RepID=A0A285NJJ8_9AQUI|nr:hypothetical protein [Persephonella hydrogeniphila]SNZ09137.1 hypothetical protein SAMN06265182_1487 [Persephonella hydrogeniphila]